MNSAKNLSLGERINLWLEKAHWSKNPFADPRDITKSLRKAEDEEGDLVSYYLENVIYTGFPRMDSYPPCTDEDQPRGDRFFDLLINEHSILFAHWGEGKTASCLSLKRNIQERDEADVIEYYNFPNRDQPIPVEEHAYFILDKVVKLPAYAAMFPAQSIDWSRPLEELGRICNELKRPVFVLVDQIEENLGPEATVPQMERMIAELFHANLWGLPNLYFKFFVHISLVRKVQTYYVVDSGGFDQQPFFICWDERQLAAFIENRLREVTNGSTDLDAVALTPDAKGQPFRLQDEVIDLALQGKRGAPRQLMRIINGAIQEHLRLDPDVDRFQISREVFERASQRWRDQISGQSIQ
ncbi:MAG: hypothetical protein JNM70_01335 [Anaerolineae bacterium]|nr:hypothetical protein [Anaerolineae bacterium]